MNHLDYDTREPLANDPNMPISSKSSWWRGFYTGMFTSLIMLILGFIF